MEFAKVGTRSLTVLAVGAVLCFVLPIVIALIWKVRKKEPISTILVGAATFLLFALILEKPIQNALLFPTQIGMAEHSISKHVNARPFLLAFLAGLFPGVFEETGRLVAYKTVLKNRKNRETSISHGIGHGGMEVILILGLSYITYFAYAVMINGGTFGTLVEQTAAQAPDQVDAVVALADQLTKVTFADLGAGLAERFFSVLFHIGASILVFYACRDRGKFWLYPLAILLHTAMDIVAASYQLKIIEISMWTLEGIIAVFGILVFLGAYCLLYRKDTWRRS